jgi:hypothetical protein
MPKVKQQRKRTMRQIEVNGELRTFLDIAEILVIGDNPDIYGEETAGHVSDLRIDYINEVIAALKDVAVADKQLRTFAGIESYDIQHAVMNHPNCSKQTVEFILRTTQSEDGHQEAKIMLQSRKWVK